MKKERRDFLKITAVGATGLALTRTTPARAAWPSSGKMEINPDISNMRVVACVDTAMMKSKPASNAFATQNAAVNYAQVQADMDAMAMSLAQKSTADEAWKTIFRLSSGKDWASAVVAIKVNAGEAKNTARLAVLQKFSNIFTGWGVKPENFIIYDGHTGTSSSVASAVSIFGSSFSTTDKTKILGVVSGLSGQSGDLLGGFKDAPLPNGSPTTPCAAKIADGTVDILIDIANNKGHTLSSFGLVTLCMKNHYGTFKPDANHTNFPNLIFNMNKSDAIIGGTPARQQLCFVDSIFINNKNITGDPDSMPCYLVMGTFAPAVDYLTVKKIREAVSGLTHNSTVIDQYVTSFGYATSDPQWTLVPPATVTSDAGTPGSGGSGGTNAGGTGGSGGASTGGAKGTGGSGGANAGGSNGSGGTASGGTKSSGGANAGGSNGSGGVASGGAKGVGGASAGGSNGSGGTASGGVSGSGGVGSGGATGAGGIAGSGGSSGGSGGTLASSTPGGGGMAASGGATGGAGTSANVGCACHVGGARVSTSGLGAVLVVGTLIAGQLRRLFLRREKLAPSTPQPKQSQAATPFSVAAEDDKPHHQP